MRRDMFVTKRSGQQEPLRLQEIQDKLTRLSRGLNVAPSVIALNVCDSLTDGISTSLIDEICAEISMEFFTSHTDYERLAVRLLVDNMHRSVPLTFRECMESLYACGRLSRDFMEYVRLHPELDDAVDRESDFDLSFFGLKTLINNKYLLRDAQDTVGELPCYMLLRVAVGIHVKRGGASPHPTHCAPNKTTWCSSTASWCTAGTLTPRRRCSTPARRTASSRPASCSR